MILHRRRQIRRGIAAVEMALLAPVLLLLLVGVWELGRVIQIRNLLDDAAREGGRMAGSASYFSSSNHANPSGGTLSLIPPSTNSDYEVQKKVLLYLKAAGVDTTGATVTVKNHGSSTSAKTWSYTWNQTGTGSGTGYDPSAASDQSDLIQVTVTLPYQNVAWSPLNWFVDSGTTLTSTAYWGSMRDIPLTISTTIPSQPLLSTDPLP